jgi:hypothetical protein
MLTYADVCWNRACNFGCVQDKVDLKNDPPGFGHYYKQLLKVLVYEALSY